MYIINRRFMRRKLRPNRVYKAREEGKKGRKKEKERKKKKERKKGEKKEGEGG